MAPRTKTTKTTTPATPAPVPVPVPVTVAEPEPVQETTSEDVTLTQSFKDILTQLTNLRTQIGQLSAQVRIVEKRADKELKTAQKAGKKRQRKTTNRAPSGFVKPTRISTELATFLGKKEDELLARTEVTREINKYIRENNLQDPANGRHIIPDKKLRTLLKLKKEDELTYFNLQKYMSHHFPKNAPVAEAK